MLFWPVIKQISGAIYAQQGFSSCAKFVTKYLKEHKQDLDDDNIRDLMDLMLKEVKNTTGMNSIRQSLSTTIV